MEGYEELVDSDELVDSEELVDPEELGDSIKTILNPVPSSPRPNWWDGEQSRYVKGGQSQSATDDLRPAPLNSGQKSFLEMLEEGPPEQYDTAPATSSSANAPSADPASETKLDHPDKEQVVSKSKFASLRKLKLFSSNKKANDSQGGIGLRSLFGPSRRKNMPVLMTQDSDGRYGLLTSYPATQGSTTTAAVSSTTTPHHLTNMSNTSSSPGKIHGQPPASMTRPVIPHKVTGDHLNLTSYPPVSKDDLATLPKEVEPTLSVYEQTLGNHCPALRRCHSATSICESSQVSNRLANYPLPVPKRSRKGAIKKYDRNDPATRTIEILAHEEIFGRELTIEKYAPPETVELARREASKVKKPGSGLSIREFAEVQHKSGFSNGSGSSLATPVTPKGGHLTPSTSEFLDYYENIHRNSKASGRNSQRSSNRQFSGEVTASPKLPRIHEDHDTIFETPSQGHQRSVDQMLSSGNGNPVGVLSRPSRRLFTPTLPAQGQSSGNVEGNVLSQSDVNRHVPTAETVQGQSSSNAGGTALAQPDFNRHIPVANPTITPSMANVERYFRHCTPDSMHSARLGILNVNDRVRVVSDAGSTRFPSFH
ncbi:MAG: hypothetical protein Q9188_003602 [Gyalolechia gomerana]